MYGYGVASCLRPLVGFGPREQEQKRPPNGPVKILCLPYDGRAQQRHERRHESVLCFETLFGAGCWVDSMFVWFPAAWMPLVVDAIRAKNVWWEGVGGHQGAVASTDPLQAPLPYNREFSFKFKKWQIDEDGKSPILNARVNVDWLTLDTKIFAHFFPQLYNGILDDVFTQKASMGWHPASTCRLVVSLLLPGSLEVEDWLLLARQKRNMWPMQMTTHTVASNLSTEQFMRRERRRLKARHIWVALNPQWIKLKERLFTRHVTNLGWGVLHERLFLNKYGSQQRFWGERPSGRKRGQWFQQSATAPFPSQLVLSRHFLQFDYADANSWKWIHQQEHNVPQVWHTRQGVYRRKVLADVRDEPMHAQQ